MTTRADAMCVSSLERYEWTYTQRQLGGKQYDWPIYKFDVLLTTYEVAIADVEELEPV